MRLGHAWYASTLIRATWNSRYPYLEGISLRPQSLVFIAQLLHLCIGQARGNVIKVHDQHWICEVCRRHCRSYALLVKPSFRFERIRMIWHWHIVVDIETDVGCVSSKLDGSLSDLPAVAYLFETSLRKACPIEVFYTITLACWCWSSTDVSTPLACILNLRDESRRGTGVVWFGMLSWNFLTQRACWHIWREHRALLSLWRIHILCFCRGTSPNVGACNGDIVVIFP